MTDNALLQHWLCENRFRGVLAGLALLLGYFLLAQLGIALAVPPGYASPFWPAAGFAVAGTLLLGRTAWRWVFLASALSNLSHADTTAAAALSLLTAGGAAFECWLAATLCRHHFSHSMRMSTEGSVWSFLLYGAAIPATLGASIASASMLALGIIGSQQFIFEWLSWWAGDAIGIALVCPAVLFLFTSVKITSRFFAIHFAPVAFLLLFISFGHLAINHYQRENVQTNTDTLVQSIEKTFAESIEKMLLPLEFTASFIIASEFVRRDEFIRFIDHPAYRQTFSTIAWAPKINASERRQYERQQGFPILALLDNGRVEVEQQQAYYYPSTYVFPPPSVTTYQGINILSTCFEPYPVDKAIQSDSVLFIPPSSRRCTQQDVTYVIKPVHRTEQSAAEGALVAMYDLNTAMKGILAQIADNNMALTISTSAADGRTVQMLSSGPPRPVEIASLQKQVGDNKFSIHLTADSLYWQATTSPLNYLYTLFTIVSAFSIAGAVMGSANRQSTKDYEIRQRTQSLTRELQARKQAEQQLSSTATLLYTAIEMADMGVWEIDFTHRNFVLSDSLMAMLGKDIVKGQKATIPINEFIANYFPKKDADIAFKTFAKSDSTRTHYSLEHQLRCADGSFVTVQSQCHVQRDDNNKPLHALGISLNVSQFREAEAALRKARDDAEAANRAKSDFLARMSHEIRTPMNGVVGMLEILQQDTLDPKQRSSIDIARSSADSLMHVIDDILDFSKIEAGGLTLESIDFDPRRTLAEVLDLMTPIAQEKDVQLHCYASLSTPTRLLGDPLRLRQVLINLIGNAIKYSANPKSPGVVQILLGQTEKLLRLDIIDNGIGISKEALPRLFTPFSQADETTTRHFGGTGLGLAISRELVELMGGTITASSTPNKKTCFSIRLPLHGYDAPSLPPALPQDIILFGIAPECAAAIDSDARHVGGSCHIIHRASDRPALTGKRPVIILMHSEAAALSKDERSALSADLAVDTYISIGGSNAAKLSDQHIALGNAVLSLQYIADVNTQILCKPEAPQAETASPPSQEAIALGAFPKLLVAEDSNINQKVIAQQLERCGYTADYAYNGEQALALWQQHEYPVLITDLHMPERDGYSLAREIRRREKQGSRAKIAIIALSANVISGEREKCQAAGIDTFLTKPTNIEALRQCLGKYINQQSEPGSTARANVRLADNDLAILDLSVFKRHTGGDDALALEFAELFKQTLYEAEQEFDGLLEKGDGTAISNLAHTLKSSAAAIGAQQLAARCLDMEKKYGRDEDTNQQLIAQWRLSIAQLKPVLDATLSNTV